MKPTPAQLYKEYIVEDATIKYVVVQQYYMTENVWKFKTYRCYHCDRSFKLVNSLTKHHISCKTINTLKEKTNANTDNNS